jgi:hypothetical protein
MPDHEWQSVPILMDYQRMTQESSTFSLRGAGAEPPREYFYVTRHTRLLCREDDVSVGEMQWYRKGLKSSPVLG